MQNRNTAHVDDNAIKGVLILSIVVGHSLFLKSTQIGGSFVAFLYFWHVQGFFLLLSRREQSRRGTKDLDMLVRYIIPYLLVAGGIGALRAIASGQPHAFAEMLMGLFMGNSSYLDDYSGAVYWFVPTFLFVLMAWRILAPHADRPVAAAAIVGAGLLSTFVPADILKQLPLGLGLVPYILAMMAIHRLFSKWIDAGPDRTRALLALFLGATAIVWYLIWNGSTVNLGFFRFGRDPVAIFMGLIYPVLIFEAIAWATRVVRMPDWLRALGAASFGIFLFHQPILFSLTMFGRSLGYETPAGMAVSLAAIVVTVIGSYILDRGLRSYAPTKRFIFPKDRRELLGRAS